MQLTKHHGLGNSFLVLLDLIGARTITHDLVQTVCDVHRGVGADGFIQVTRGKDGAHVTMHLYNADGSRAEMSGNGVSCVAQAVVLADLVPELLEPLSATQQTESPESPESPESEDASPDADDDAASAAADEIVVRVGTDAGMRLVTVRPDTAPGTHHVTAEVGDAQIGDEMPEWLDDAVVRAVRVDIGNPHVVLHAPDPEVEVDLVARGREIGTLTPGGANVEVIRAGEADDELRMAVYERGVGLTDACGTGAAAAAAAARAWELCGDKVHVAMPGGSTLVEMRETIRLTLPIVYVAAVDFRWS